MPCCSTLKPPDKTMCERKIHLPQGNLSSVGYATGMSLVLTLGYTYVIAELCLLARFPESPYILIVGFIGASITLLITCTRRCFIRSIISSLVIWIAGIWLGMNTCDYSWDGIGYHQVTIYALADGWNPIWNDYYEGSLSLWTIHYAKALELIAACIFRLTGEIEAGKALNIVFFVAVFAISLGFIKKNKINKKRGLSDCNAVIFALLVAGNPVALCQLMTYYIDYALYYYVVLSIIFSVGICKGDNNVYLNIIGLCLVILLAIGTKFNHFFIEGIVMLAVMGWLMISRQYYNARKILIISFLSALVGTFILSFHPYLTNWIYFGNPFYPLMGDDAVNIMDCNTPPLYWGHNRFETFFMSIYGPYSIPSFDSRISGFGPFFKVLLTIGLLWIFYSEITQKQLSVIGYITIMALISCFFFEQSWWARYNPQIWIIIPTAYYSIISRISCVMRGRLLAKSIISIVGLINIFVVLLQPTLDSFRLYTYRNCVFRVLAGKEVKAHVGKIWEYKLKKEGIIPLVVGADEIPEEYRTPILHLPEYEISYNWLETTPEERENIQSMYENSSVYVIEKRAISVGKAVIVYIKQLI